MPRRSQNEPELKNALQDATNSLETIMAEYTASLIRKYFEWPIRMDSELAALRKKLENEENGTPVGLAERMDESILEQVSLPQMFGSAVKRKKAKRKSKKKSNRLAKLKPPFEQDEGLCEDIDDEISFKHPGPTYLKSMTPKGETLSLTKIKKKTPPRVPGRPPRRAAFSKASAVFKENPSGLEGGGSSRRLAGSSRRLAGSSRRLVKRGPGADVSSANASILSEMSASNLVVQKCPNSNMNSGDVIKEQKLESNRTKRQIPTKDVDINDDHVELDLIDDSISVEPREKRPMFSTMESTPVVPVIMKSTDNQSDVQSESSKQKIMDPQNETVTLTDSLQINEISSTAKKRKSNTNITENMIPDQQTKFRQSGTLLSSQNSSIGTVKKSQPREKKPMFSTMESTPVVPVVMKSTDNQSDVQSESSKQKIMDPQNETVKLTDTTQSNEIFSGAASKKRKSNINITENMIPDQQTELRRSGRLLNCRDSLISTVRKSPDVLHQITSEAQSSKQAEKLATQGNNLPDTPKTQLENSTMKVLNKPELPLPKLSASIQTCTTKSKYLSSLKPQSSQQLASGQRSIAVERKQICADAEDQKSKVTDDGRFEPKRGFQSQHNNDVTMEQTKHISFSVSLTPTNGPRTSKKRYPVSPLAENVLKKSFKPNMDNLDEEESDDGISEMSNMENQAPKSTQNNLNETYNTCRVLLPRTNPNQTKEASRIIAPTPPPPKVTSVLSTPQSSSKWSTNTGVNAPKSLFGFNKQSNLVTNVKSFWNTSQIGTPTALKNKQNFKQKADEAAEMRKAAFAEKEKRDRERIKQLQQKLEQERLEKKRLNEERILKCKENAANLMQNQTAAKSGASASSIKVSALGGLRLNPNLNSSRHLLGPSTTSSSAVKKVITSSEKGGAMAKFVSAGKPVQLPRPQHKHNYCVMESLLWTCEEYEDELEDNPDNPKNVVPHWAKKSTSVFGKQKSRRLVKNARKRQFVKITTIPPLEAIFMTKHPGYERPRRSTGVWHTVIDAKINESSDCSIIL